MEVTAGNAAKNQAQACPGLKPPTANTTKCSGSKRKQIITRYHSEAEHVNDASIFRRTIREAEEPAPPKRT